MTTPYNPNPPTTLGLDEINLADPDFWLRDDYHDALTKLRNTRPISWHEHRDSGKGHWALLDYNDIVEVTRDWTHFVNKYGTRVQHDYGSGQIRPGTGVMSELDPPAHTKNRAQVSQAFTPRQVKKMEDYVRQQAERIVSEFSAGDEVDFVTEIAAKLPLEIICDVLGVPKADRPMLYDLTNRSLGDQDPEYGQSPDEGSKATLAIRADGVKLGAERLAKPADDLMSEIARIDYDGQKLTKEQLGGYFAILAVAGNETSRTAMSWGLHAFSKFPEQKRKFLEDPIGLGPSAAEEIIRWATPVRNMARTVEEDLEFKGVAMKKGQKLALWFASSNRDPRYFPSPFQFDITRDPNPMHSFGAGGPHFCLGANIARREVYVLFQELFKRFPNAEAIGEPRRLRSVSINGIKSLRVRL